MAEPIAAVSPPRRELPLHEARTRFVQLVRLAGLTGQSTLVTDAGRPLAVISPPDAPGRDAATASTAAGWMRRVEKLRADLRRQHEALEQALEQAWQELDRLRPPGTDRDVDALRTVHSTIRRPAND